MGNSWSGNKRGGRDFTRGDRSGRDAGGYERGNDRTPSREARPERAPLQWQTIESIVQGQVEIQISAAKSDRGGVMYSWCMGKAPSGDRPGMRFNKPDAIHDAKEALSQLEVWLETHREGGTIEVRAPGVHVEKIS